MNSLRQRAKGRRCVLCDIEDESVVLHHIQLPGNHGMGLKPNDFPWGVRLCNSHHQYFHNEGRGDHKLMALALGKQMQMYVEEGVVTVL